MTGCKFRLAVTLWLIWSAAARHIGLSATGASHGPRPPFRPHRGRRGAALLMPQNAPTYPTASDLPYHPPRPSRRGRVARRLDAGKGRRLRQRANVARGPGRLRPRVPPPPLGAVCAGRALDGAARRAQMPGHGSRKRNGRRQKSPDGRPEGRDKKSDERVSGRPSPRPSKWPDAKAGVAAKARGRRERRAGSGVRNGRHTLRRHHS